MKENKSPAKVELVNLLVDPSDIVDFGIKAECGVWGSIFTTGGA